MKHSMDNEIGNGKTEMADLLKAVIYVDKRALLFLFVAVFLMLVVTLGFKIAVPSGIIFAFLTLVLTIFFANLFLYGHLPVKPRTFDEFENSLVGFYFVHLLVYTIIVHYLGGVEWIGVIIYFFLIVEASIILSRKKALIVTLGATIFYTSLLFLEYFGILPHHRFFVFAPNPHQNLLYLFLTILTAALIGFHYCSYLIGTFSGMFRRISDDLRKERKELIKAKKELEESKAILEIKVRARTKELEELTQSLEEQVRERTKELQEKLEELERFQRLAVGRELKMIELKKEIKRLKEELQKR
jgi:hypothetical protein